MPDEPNVVPFPARAEAEPPLTVAALRDMAEMNRKLSVEGAACLVDILANAVERAPEERVTRERILGLLREVAAGIRELKLTGRLA